MSAGVPTDRSAAAPVALVAGTDEARLADWDRHAVEAPGGHVFQSRTWAAHRERTGWRPRFVAFDDGSRVLALVRAWPLVGGASAYVPRGPVPLEGGLDRAALLADVSRLLRDEGVDVVAADAEVPASEAGYRERIESNGFRPIEEIQPSRHRLTLPLPAGSDEEAAFAGIAKSTRQRIRSAERLRVIRYDARWAADPAAADFARPTEASDGAFARFARLLEATGERRGFKFGRAGFIDWWGAGHRAGHVLLLEAWGETEPIAGLLLYRHGGRISTAHSADRAELRRAHPGALHLLRWRALQIALAEGCDELDLGGVDVPGARRPPREGEPMYGLYQHKLSFGARWLELTGAYELVFRPGRYLAGRIAARGADVVARARHRVLGGAPFGERVP